jgi:hypothetical protein
MSNHLDDLFNEAAQTDKSITFADIMDELTAASNASRVSSITETTEVPVQELINETFTRREDTVQNIKIQFDSTDEFILTEVGLKLLNDIIETIASVENEEDLAIQLEGQSVIIQTLGDTEPISIECIELSQMESNYSGAILAVQYSIEHRFLRITQGENKTDLYNRLMNGYTLDEVKP